jgi:hypothetical protein
MTYIPIAECKNGGLYRIYSRNLSLGVYREEAQGFVGIREKFGNEYLFTEYHWDISEPYGTVQPKEFLEMCPIKDLRETIGSIDSLTKRRVKFDKPISDDGKGWYFEDTGETCQEVGPVSVENDELFKYLEEKEKQYG